VQEVRRCKGKGGDLKYQFKCCVRDKEVMIELGGVEACISSEAVDPPSDGNQIETQSRAASEFRFNVTIVMPCIEICMLGVVIFS
jgi:hypothetical protein